MFRKTNKSMPAVAETDDTIIITSYDDLLAGDVFVGKNGEEYEVDVIRNEHYTVGNPTIRHAPDHHQNGRRVYYPLLS